MISYLNNPVGFYGSSNDDYVNSSISAVETFRSNNDKSKMKQFASLVKESVFAESGQEDSALIEQIKGMFDSANTLKKKADGYQALSKYAGDLGASKTKKAIANGDSLHFYCNYENPNDPKYCKPFQPSGGGSNGGNGSNGGGSYTMYYIAGGIGLLAILGYVYRDEIKKLY